MLTFIRTFIGVKTDQAVQAGVEALVRWDPQAATEAELRTMERRLDELGMEVAKARAAYKRERKEAEATRDCSTSVWRQRSSRKQRASSPLPSARRP